MNNQDNIMRGVRDELEMWTQMWDEAEPSHPPIEPPKPSALEEEDPYFNYLDDEASVDIREKRNEMLTEEKVKTPNPVYPDSSGPDFTTTPPVWVSEDLLKTVEDLKNKLFDVENRMAKEMGGGEKWVEKVHDPDHKKTLSEIESLKQRIEKVSSTLGTDHESSPWVVQRD